MYTSKLIPIVCVNLYYIVCEHMYIHSFFFFYVILLLNAFLNVSYTPKLTGKP